jgi:hypothetical protein
MLGLGELEEADCGKKRVAIVLEIFALMRGQLKSLTYKKCLTVDGG